MVLLENETPSWADGNDDDGTLTEGTATDAALFDGYRSTLDAQLHSTTNPTVRPKAITDEVVTARGNLSNLNARFAGIIDANGLFINPGFVEAASALSDISSPGNLLLNDNFLLWHLGDALAPSAWTLTGAGATVARTGAGLADTTDPLLGPWACKMTYGSATAVLKQAAVASSGAVHDRLANYFASILVQNPDGDENVVRPMFAGALVWSSVPGVVQVGIRSASGITYSDPHSGGSVWEWLCAPQTCAGHASIELTITGAASAYFAAARLGVGEGLDISRAWAYLPTMIARREKDIPLLAGAQTVRNNIWRWQPRRPCIITDVQISATTGPTVTALIYDLKSWDGAAFTSMFTTLPQIAAGQTRGGAQPDGTYARRCLYPYFGTAIAAGGEVRLDCTQIGSGVAGSDVAITIGYLEWERPLEGFYDYNTLG